MIIFRRLILVVLTISLSACSGEQEALEASKEMAVQTSPLPPDIEIFTVEVEPFTEVIKATGTIAAKQTSRIGPLVEGVLEKVYVRVGDRPRKGEPLFQMRVTEYQQAFDQATAAFQVARAELDLSIKKLKRAKRLRQDNLLSQDDLDLTETSASIARAQLNSAQASLAAANQLLKDTLVVAPFDGTVTGRFADEGVYMSNRFSMGAQSSVVELSEADIVAGIMRVPEAQLPKLKLGQSAILYPGEVNEGYESKVYIINDRVDPTTRTAEFRLPVQNKDYKIKPGQFAFAEVFMAPRDVIKVPKTAVVEEQAHQFVFLQQDNSWVKTKVKSIAFDDEFFEIQQGLSAGQKVARLAHLVSKNSTVREAHHVDR